MIKTHAKKIKTFCIFIFFIGIILFILNGSRPLLQSFAYGMFTWAVVSFFTTSLGEKLLQKNIPSSENGSAKTIGMRFFVSILGKFGLGTGLLIFGLKEFHLHAGALVGGATFFLAAFTMYGFLLSAIEKKHFPESKN